MARGLAANGHSVRVVTGYPHYPQWRVLDGYTGRTMHEDIDGVSVKRVHHVVPSTLSTMRRSAMEVHFGLRAVFSRWGRPDVVVVVSPALLSSSLVALRARLTRTPIVTWVQDIYTLGLTQSGASDRAESTVRRVETSLLRGSTRIVAIHERFKRYLVNELRVGDNVDVVRNWSHVHMTTTDRDDEVRLLHGWADDDVVVLHAGNMGAKQGLENVVAASRVAHDSGSRVKFVLVGDGNQRARLEALDPNPRLQFIDPLPDGLFERTLSSADVLLVNERPGLTEMSVPSKLTTYYAAGRPVIAAVDSTSITAEEMQLSGAGPSVGPSDPSALVTSAEMLAARADLAASHVAAAQAFRTAHLSEAAAVKAFERALLRAIGGQASLTVTAENSTGVELS
ncbi:MAG: glycosyltransferase family 4 protein [Flavobacterium sp.]|nr:glycosyltransferase family 4 protein [Aeromicrobium sp.]